MPIYPVVYAAAQAFTAHASDPRVFDALYITTSSGAGSLDATLLETSNSVTLAGIVSGTTIPVRTRLVTALAGTGVAAVGLKGPNFPYYFKSAAAITLHDTNPNIFDAIWVSAGGTFIYAPLTESADVSVTAVTGSLLPFRTRLCKTTGASGTYVGLRL